MRLQNPEHRHLLASNLTPQTLMFEMYLSWLWKMKRNPVLNQWKQNRGFENDPPQNLSLPKNQPYKIIRKQLLMV
jgi:hypothetical protein